MVLSDAVRPGLHKIRPVLKKKVPPVEVDRGRRWIKLPGLR